MRNKLNRRNFLKLFGGAAAGMVVITKRQPVPELEPEPEAVKLEDEIAQTVLAAPLGGYSCGWFLLEDVDA